MILFVPSYLLLKALILVVPLISELSVKFKAVSRISGLVTVAKLIGCHLSDLKLALSTRNMKVRNENIVQRLTLSQVWLKVIIIL